jgi:hypothetical protein
MLGLSISVDRDNRFVHFSSSRTFPDATFTAIMCEETMYTLVLIAFVSSDGNQLFLMAPTR